MPPNSQVAQQPSSSFGALPAIAITIVVILIVIGLAWYAKLISFSPTQNASLQLNTYVTPTSATKAEPTTMTLSSGTYGLTGRGAGQAESYAGTVTISKRGTTSNIYDLVWHITSGQAQSGVGIFTNNVLSVSYYEARDGVFADIGVVSYKVIDTSHLEGEWTSVQGGTAGIEQLSLQPSI